MKPKLVVFTGAGISAESGIKTFRDSDGLWEEYNINDTATPQAWAKNQALVLDFYNKRRAQVIEAQPNKAHHALLALEKNMMYISLPKTLMIYMSAPGQQKCFICMAK